MGDVILANGFDRPTLHVGGANYLWYELGPLCDREPYGLLPNYDQPGVRALAQQQLASMYMGGMRTLAIGIYFLNGSHTGTLVDAADPVQVGRAADNLDMLLDDIHAAGFERVMFRLFPGGNMNPSEPNYDPASLDLYWQMIETMHARLESGDVPFLVDLGVELAPADKNSKFCDNTIKSHKWQCPADKAWSNAVRELWRRYRAAYGTVDTVGFSFLTSTNRARRRVRHMKYVYDDKYPGAYPQALALDLYGEDGHGVDDQFINMAGLVRDYGNDYGFATSSFVISETWYNDPFVAAGLSSAIAATGQPVSYLTQWPLDRNASCAHVSEPPPYQYDIYRLYGF